MNDRLPETILIRMSDGKIVRCLFGGMHTGYPSYIFPLYALYDNSTHEQKPEGDVTNHPSDGTPPNKA